jgi:hypothetical protein
MQNLCGFDKARIVYNIKCKMNHAAQAAGGIEESI